MMAANGRMGMHSPEDSQTQKSRDAVGCICSISQPGSTSMPSHVDMVYGCPKSRPAIGVALSMYRHEMELLHVTATDAKLPDPPPKSPSV